MSSRRQGVTVAVAGGGRDEWRLTTQQFRLLWSRCDGAPFPAELCAFGDDEPYDNADVHRASELATLGELEKSTTPVMRSAMRALTHPRYTIGVVGVDARKSLSDTSHHLRIVSAWGGGGDTVVVARQKPGSSASRGGGVIVTRHPFATWARDLMGLLPRSAGAGRLSEVDHVPFDEIPIDVEVVRQVSAAASESTAAGVFVHGRPTTCGSMRVQVGSEVDGNRPVAVTVQYRDIAGDGRYLLITDSTGAAFGADDARMASTVNRVMNVAKKRYDERANAGWE